MKRNRKYLLLILSFLLVVSVFRLPTASAMDIATTGIEADTYNLGNRTVIDIDTMTTPYISYRYLAENTAHRHTFTPTESGCYSFWTTGSTDMYISVYSDLASSVRVGYDDDDGHMLNASLTLELTQGNTYYIVARGAFTSTSGIYTLKVQKGLPMSGAEESKNFVNFNASAYKRYTNCYTYALNSYVHPLTGKKFRWNGQNPGEMSGDSIELEDLTNATTAKAAIIAAVKMDCVYWGGSAGDFYEVERDTMVPEGYYKVALVLDPGSDYHWYRQVLDLDGAWAHKLSTLAATETDDNGEMIYNPEDAEVDGYTEFLGFFALKPPSAYTASVASNVWTNTQDVNVEDEIVYDVKEDIYLSQFLEAESDQTTREKLRSIVGEAHDYRGSGYVREVYYTVDGYTVEVYYRYTNGIGLVDQIRTINADGTYNVVVR